MLNVGPSAIMPGPVLRYAEPDRRPGDDVGGQRFRSRLVGGPAAADVWGRQVVLRERFVPFWVVGVVGSVAGAEGDVAGGQRI